MSRALRRRYAHAARNAEFPKAKAMSAARGAYRLALYRGCSEWSAEGAAREAAGQVLGGENETTAALGEYAVAYYKARASSMSEAASERQARQVFLETIAAIRGAK